MTQPKQYGSTSGTTECFIVEARMNYFEPKEYRGVILDGRWRRIHFPSAPIGIPNELTVFQPQAAQQGYLSYDAALALAHWFMVPEALMGGICVETRLVRLLFTFQYSAEEKGVGPAMSMIEIQRASIFEERKSEHE